MVDPESLNNNAEALNRDLFPSGEQVFKDAAEGNEEFWSAYAEEFKEEPVIGANLGGRLMSQTIKGKSESGAKIRISRSDTQVFHRLPKPGEYDPPAVDESTGKLVQYKQGVTIEVTPPSDDEEGSRTVTLYIPADAEAHPEIEPPHAVTFETAHDGKRTKKIVPAENPVPEDEDLFDKGVAEIKFYLGDRIIWDSPEGKEIPSTATPYL